MSNAIHAGGLAVPDQALSRYPAYGHAAGIRAALAAIEEGLGDEVAWTWYAAGASRSNEAENALRVAVAVYGRRLLPKPPRRSHNLPVPDTAPRRAKPETVVHSQLFNPDE